MRVDVRRCLIVPNDFFFFLVVFFFFFFLWLMEHKHSMTNLPVANGRKFVYRYLVRSSIVFSKTALVDLNWVCFEDVWGILNVFFLLRTVYLSCHDPPRCSPSRGGDASAFAFLHKSSELAHSFSFSSCIYICFYGSFTCISFYKFSRQLPAFPLCSSGLISALLIFRYITIYESLPQPWYNPLRLTGIKASNNY